MTNQPALRRGVSTLVSIAALVVASIAPAIIGVQKVSAAQLTSRKVTLGSSKVSQTDVKYTPSFVVATTGVIEGIVVDFCSNSPLIGAACTAPTGFDVNEVGLAIANQTGITGFTLNAATDTNTVILTNAAGGSVNSGVTVSFDLGAAGASDGITNPSTNGTFYARILTYDTDTTAAAYAPGTPGTHTDNGGIALSTANQLTINARVQEQLQFCVGTVAIPATAPSDCTGLTGTTVDLGVIDSGAVNVSPVAVASGGNNLAGAAMVRTNAANGVVIDYFAEQATSGTNHLGALRVSGATCNAGTSSSDQCFNSAGTTISPFVAGTEEFGLTIGEIDRTGSTTTNLTEDTNYDGDGTAATGFAWDQSGTFDRLASSAAGVQPENRVVDDEMLELRFAATAAVTTPTGAYTVTSTYVATSTF
jgi:hypothetical protein